MATISLVGRISGNFKVSQTENGTYCIFASVAENNRTKDGREYPEWYQVTLFSKSNAIERYLDKGARVYIVGRLTFDEYKDEKTGRMFYHKRINADVFDLLDWKKQDEPEANLEAPISNG